MAEGPGAGLATLAGRLQTHAFGRRHLHLEEVDSTNDRLFTWMRATPPAPHGALVTAQRQTQGRGRLGRRWDSEGDDIYASVALRPGPTPGGLGALGLAVGLGLAEGLVAAVPGLAVELKWPNDLLVGGRKLGGILCETRWVGAEPEVVVGFGVNVGRRVFEGELAERATSVALALEASGTPAPAPVELLAAMLLALERRCRAFLSGGFPVIREAYLARCESLGRELWVDQVQPDGQTRRILARVEDLDPDGALRVRSLGGGASFRVQSADVWLQGPAGDTQGAC